MTFKIGVILKDFFYATYDLVYFMKKKPISNSE